jgi:hypothetical protein
LEKADNNYNNIGGWKSGGFSVDEKKALAEAANMICRGLEIIG